LAGVNPDLLRHYERVSKFRGSGIAEVLNQKCMGCQVMLRPQTYNDVRAGSIVMCESCQRILYVDPAKEVAPEPVVERHRRRPRPKFDAPVAWFYHPNYGEHGEVLLGFVNDSGNASRQVFDFNTGRQVGDALIREGTYPLAFPEDLGEAVRLNGDWDEAEMETWGQEMPMTVLDALHADLNAARQDAKSHGAKHDHAHAAPSEHPAAS